MSRSVERYMDIRSQGLRFRLDMVHPDPYLATEYGEGGCAQLCLHWPGVRELRAPIGSGWGDNHEFGRDRFGRLVSKGEAVETISPKTMQFPDSLVVDGFGGCRSILTKEGAKDWADCTIRPNRTSWEDWRNAAIAAGLARKGEI